MDRRTANLLDRHIQGLDDPNAPFNQVDRPEWMCLRCGWEGDDPVETEYRDVSEAWGSKVVRKTIEYTCPEEGCKGDCVEWEAPEPDDGAEDAWEAKRELRAQDAAEEFKP
ncbi:hypothetical protein CCP3SC15_580028 [Gammaproteobacteria bacterium]